jgi:dienelactone hydrolase
MSGASSAVTRTAFLQGIDRPRVALEASTRPALELGASLPAGVVAEHFSFASEAGVRVPGLLLQPATSAGPRPAVVVAHGTGGSKEAMLPFLLALCARGLVAVAIDARHHGERAREAGGGSYVAAILAKYQGGPGYPFLYDTVWDLLRLLDYLAERADVAAERLGLMGISKGGMETYLAAAADPRIVAAVPVLGVQSYRSGLERDAWHARVGTFQSAFDGAARAAGVEKPDVDFVRQFYDRVVPGIYAEFDGPNMLELIAPRPLLVVNGELDPRTPGLEECERRALAAYARTGAAADALRFLVQPATGHEFTPAAVELSLDWLQRWLSA